MSAIPLYVYQGCGDFVSRANVRFDHGEYIVERWELLPLRFGEAFGIGPAMATLPVLQRENDEKREKLLRPHSVERR